MEYKKPVKVKSRWTQSCQIEMMKEESQSSLDDTVTDISTNDLKKIIDTNSELSSIEIRRSCRTSSNKTDYRQLLGLKKSRQKKPMSSKASNIKKERKKKHPLNTFNNNKDDNEFINIYKYSAVDWDLLDTSRRPKSVTDELSKSVTDGLPKKRVRQSSLSWNFKFTATNKVIDNSALEKNNYPSLSNEIKSLNINDNPLQIPSPLVANKILSEDDKLFDEMNKTCEKIPLSSINSNTNALNYRNKNQQNIYNFENLIVNDLSTNNFIESEQSVKNIVPLNFVDLKNQCDEKNSNHINDSIVSKLGISCSSSDCKPRNIRSRSVDSSITQTNDDNHNILKRSKSYDCINKYDKSTVNFIELQKSKNKSPKKKRRQSKRIKPKNNYIEILDDMKIPENNYDQVAKEIYMEHEKQLSEARSNDAEFDKKLKSTNFTLTDENLYRPDRQAMKMYPSSDIPSLRKLKQRVISGDINLSCECTLSKEDIFKGKAGCDDQCLNRLLKIECGSSCFLKRYCTNKQFQNKQFKRTKLIKTENKGYGICAVEDIPKGVLISEYVGEVIDYNEMCDRLRKKEYANLNYLVQLNSDEIIDSASKGNVTRFINHSCDPNAVGEKWHVLGQSRMGFFSTRNIKKGEEITFDYSFQVFGDGAQICYCGSAKCRGYISKTSQITDLSSSEDSDVVIENRASKPEEKQKRKKNLNKRTVNNEKNKLRELDRQLTEISKLKTGSKADQEIATLNLNRLMVHITDSVSRLHILTFIREHDMNCKRLFMDFSGLSIIHNWMTSNENESFKLSILEMLSELPITNRNTITKSKVLEVVAEWAKIPQDVKAKIESLEYPAFEIQKHCQEVNDLLPNQSNDDEKVCSLVEKARALWKKWIVLKIVFKIPKKIDQPKPIEKINSSKLTEDYIPSAMDINMLDRKAFKISNKNHNKVRNRHIISSERMKLRKEYEQKITFRKNALNKWLEKRDSVVKSAKENRVQHQQTFNLLNCNNSVINHNNENKKTKWDCPTHASYMVQNSLVDHSMQTQFMNFIPPQTLQQPTQLPHISLIPQQNIFNNYHLTNQPILFSTAPPTLPNQLLISKSSQSTTSLCTVFPNQDPEPNDQSPSKRLLKSSDINVFNIINESIRKHGDSNQNKNNGIQTEDASKKSCERAVQSGADLLARVKIISNSFKNQPSKLIKINQLKEKNYKTKQTKIISSDVMLKSVCDENKKITFINEQAGVSSNTLSQDLMLTPKTVPLTARNKFANAILNSLLKKTNSEKDNVVPDKFVINNLNSEILTCNKTNQEIELYKNMKPKIVKKTVGRIKTKHGFVAVKKRKWSIKLKGLKEKRHKIPATKRGIMRKGSIHRIALKNGLVNTKSALKKRNNINVDEYLKRPKEKRVTFWIEGESSPIFPHSEVRPINLNTTTVKQKPFMKCHPFEVRNEPKSIHQPSTSAVQDDQLQLPSEQVVEQTEDQIIPPIVAKFKASRNRRINLRNKSTDFEQLQSRRKHMIPESMMFLSVDVLKLIPDNRKEMKKIIDYFHSMATIIVKILGSYAKKTCHQGRIRSDEDFKYLAKKINENVLLKELQLKKVDKLKISNSTKEKVAEYIRKYMSRFGEVYKRKPNEQTTHHKTK